MFSLGIGRPIRPVFRDTESAEIIAFSIDRKLSTSALRTPMESSHATAVSYSSNSNFTFSQQFAAIGHTYERSCASFCYDIPECGTHVICRVKANLVDYIVSLCDEMGLLFGSFNGATIVWRHR